MRVEQLEEFARIYLQHDSLVYLLPNVVPGSLGGPQKDRNEFEKARQKVQRKEMCAALGVRNHSTVLLHKIRDFQISLYDEVCKRVRTRLMRGASAAAALDEAPPSVRCAAVSLQLLSAALKHETKQLTKEGAATTIVDTLCAAWECAGRCGGCGARGGAGGCGECRSDGTPPTAVLRVAASQFDVEDLDALKRLWSQYREVALQKLRALAAAGDDPRRVPAAARPAPTDWRVIDLTLLYDHKFKLLTDTSVVHHEQLQPLIVLFSLVQQCGLERGEERPWREAHRQARGRGACVSLVQLQRRWHELCRAARGAVLSAMRHAARPPPLPPLYQAVVRRFPEVATRPLMSWRELVACGRVYTDFPQATDAESPGWLAAAPRGPAPAAADTDKEDDLILVEKDIETIELRESDGEADELVIDEDTSLAALAQDTQDLQQTIRAEIQNHRELLTNTIDNRLETDPVQQSNDTVSAMDIDNANVGEASVSNTQNFTNFLVCNENFVNFNVDNNEASNTAYTVVGNMASGGVSSNEVPSTSSLNSLDTGQNLSILHKINPESSEAMIIFDDDDDSDEMGPASGDNNSGDERPDHDRCSNAGGDSVQMEDMPVNSLYNEENTNKEAVTESQNTKDASSEIVQSDNINHVDSANHDLNKENISDEIKSKDDNTNKEVATQKQDTEDSGNQIVESNDLAESSSDKNCADQSNDANHDLQTDDISTESKNPEENANTEAIVESQDTECSKNQIIESDSEKPTSDTNGVACNIANHDKHMEESETQKEVSENIPDESKNTERATENQETDNTNQIVESNEKESNQKFEAISKNIMNYKTELKLEIDNNLEVGNSEASSADIVSDQLAIDILRQSLGKDITASEDIPKIDNAFSVVSVETKSDNEVSNDSTGNSNDAEMAVDTNVAETSESNETEAVESNSDETDSASSMDTTDFTPGVFDPKLLMTPRIPLTRIDSPSHKPSPPLLVEDFSTHPDFNLRLQGFSDSYLVKNWHLLRMCRPVSVHVERMSGALLDRYLGPGRPARRVLLPDIEEVRRANRRLLTAQVAPTPLPHSRPDSDDDGAPEQPPPPPTAEEEVKEEASMPTEEELMNLLQRCEPPTSRQGFAGGRRYCCVARRHRAYNDARARLAARAGKRAPEEQNIHGSTHRSSSCDCCCLHLLPGASDAALLVRLARRRRRLERSANKLLHRNTEQCDDDDLDDDDDDFDIATTNKAPKKTWKKKDKQPSVEKEKEPENTEQPSSKDDYSEWIRQKNLWNKYFHIQAIGDETPRTKPTNIDTAHKHADATTEPNQPIGMKTQTQTQKTYVPIVYGTNLNKDEHTSAAAEPVVVGPNRKIVNYSGNFGKTIIAMCRATDDASGANRKRKSLEDVADTPSKVTIRIPTQFDKISVDDSEIVDKIMKNEDLKPKVQSTSQTVDASVSREDSSKSFEPANNSGVVDNKNKAAEHHNSDSDDEDFVDRLFIDDTAQKLDRYESLNSDFDKLKDGNVTNDKSTIKEANTENAVAKTDTLNEDSQTNIKSNEDVEAGAQTDKSDETSELKLLPSKKVYQKVVRPKLATPNTSSNIQSDVTMATCIKKDIGKSLVGAKTEILKSHLLNESSKTSQTDSKETASETRVDDDSDDDVQIVEPTPVKATIDPRSLLKQQVRVTPPERPPTILEQIALMHEKGQKFIIQKVIDKETTPVVYKSGTKVNQISRYIGLVPEKPTTGPSLAKVVPAQPAAGPVVNLNEQLATMCSPSTTLPYNTLAKPVTTTDRPVITIKQLVPPPVVSIAPKLVPVKPGTLKPGAQMTKSKQIIYPMPVSKVTDDAKKTMGKYPVKIAQNVNAVITMQTTRQKIPASAINIKTPNSISQPMKIGNTTIMRTPKVNVNDTNSAMKVTPPIPEIKVSIPVLTIDATKNTAKADVNEVDNTNRTSPKKEAKESVPVLTLDATTVPCGDSTINASGLVLKVSQEGLVMSTGDDMATITAVASNDNVGNAGTIDNVAGDVGSTDVDDGAKRDGDSGAWPIISNVTSLAEPAANTIYMKSVSTQSGGSDSAASDNVGYSNRLGASLPALSARELARGRDPTDITVLCVDAARPLLHLRGRHLLVTELEMPCARPQYWAPAEGKARLLVFDTQHTDSKPAPPPSGGLKVRSFARLPPAETPPPPPPPPPPAAAPDRVRSDGKVYKKLCDDPLVYAKVLFVCSTIPWCRRALSSSAFVGLRAPSDEVFPVQRAAAPAAPLAPPASAGLRCDQALPALTDLVQREVFPIQRAAAPAAPLAPPASAGLRCDQALPALTDLVQRLNQLKAKPAASDAIKPASDVIKPAASDVISIDSDDE